MNKLRFIAVIIVLSFFSTVISVNYERFNPTVTGNMCGGPCYEDLPAGGFPFSYLYDNGGVSVMGTLSIYEDHFYLIWFLADVVFYLLLYSLLGLVLLKKFFPQSSKT